MHVYPTGNVTSLFTDIHGSTRRWERDPVAMHAFVERHFALLREAIEAHRGVLFKAIGDAVQAAFPSAPEAVAAALAGQRAIAAADWGEAGQIWVRMGIHFGPATPRDGDYLAPCLNRLARLLSAGYGGQILLSQAVADSVRFSLPPETTLRDLLQDQHLYQLDAPGLEHDFPPLKPLDRIRHNLPAQPTALIGRETELAHIQSLLTADTRLALQTAAEAGDTFPDGVWFVPLAPIAEAVREAMGVPLDAAYLADHDRYFETTRRALGPSAYTDAYVTGRTRPLDQTLSEFSAPSTIDQPGKSVG